MHDAPPHTLAPRPLARPSLTSLPCPVAAIPLSSPDSTALPLRRITLPPADVSNTPHFLPDLFLCRARTGTMPHRSCVSSACPTACVPFLHDQLALAPFPGAQKGHHQVGFHLPCLSVCGAPTCRALCLGAFLQRNLFARRLQMNLLPFLCYTNSHCKLVNSAIS